MKKNTTFSYLALMALVFLSLGVYPTDIQAAGATLSISPASLVVQNGQTFTADINLDTGGNDIDGIDLFSVRFDPTLLQVQDANSSVAGVQITSGTILPQTLLNAANNSTGTVQFSQVANGGGLFNGTGKVISINFKAISVGTATLVIDFSPGGTSDSNIAGGGVEQLTSVTGANITISPIIPVFPMPVVTISTNPSSITSGQSSSITWLATNATSCSASGGWNGPQATSGTKVVSPTGDTTYTLSCNGVSGTDTQSATVIVSSVVGVPAVNISANPSVIALGQSTTLTWSSSNATSCSASGGWTGVQSLSGTQVVSPSIGTMYYLTCNAPGSRSGSVFVMVNPVNPNPNPVTPTTPNPTPTTPNQPNTNPLNPNPAQNNFGLTQNLYRGLRNQQVLVLQAILVQLGYNIGGVPTGYFGPATEAAVMQFQKAQNIVSSGTPSSTGYGAVGVATRAALISKAPANMSIPTSVPSSATSTSATVTTTAPKTTTTKYVLTQTLYLGLKSPQVTTLQIMLVKLGYSIGGKPSGYFGVNTANAVKAFQRSKGISSYVGNTTGYGVVGATTRAALLRAVVAK